VIPEPSAPIIVGACAVQQRFDDPSRAADALTLMRTALEGAAADAGSLALLESATILMLPQGTWSGPDPAAVITPWNPQIRTVVAEIGVLQQTLIDRACAMVAAGQADVVVVCGGEAKYRALRSMITGIPLVDPSAPEGARLERPGLERPGIERPDIERLVPAHEVITREEIERGLPVPARQYAMIDTALRRHAGITPAEHIEQLAAFQADASAVAVGNAHAWNRTHVDAETVCASSMLAWPYTKLHCSQWNVDQAAGLIVCSVDAAHRFGVARDRWVFAHLGVESNLMVPVTMRSEIHSSPAVALVGRAIRDRLHVGPADIDHLDLYSCFPAAVRVQINELGIEPGRQLTVTGGMTFGGGPLNNYTLQALVSMVETLRGQPRTSGLVTNISGMLTKFGASVWSCEPPITPYASVDISDAATVATPTVSVDPDHTGSAQVVTYTVAFDKDLPTMGIIVGDTPDGRRALATTTDPDVMSSMVSVEWCGRTVHTSGPDFTV
jgi:acetyl-CoA C-acetyltransferase